MKRLAVLCDGTWNTPDETKDGVPAPTNVVKLAEAILPVHEGVEQHIFYDVGIGSSGWYVERVFDGATGTGISENIRQAYRFLIDRFEIGDEIFLFGFSRGAFTVRSLAGLVRSCGILRRTASNMVPQAYDLYRTRRKGTEPKEREPTLSSHIRR
jgi:uncharacterized protein (DUF2235 family)